MKGSFALCGAAALLALAGCSGGDGKAGSGDFSVVSSATAQTASTATPTYPPDLEAIQRQITSNLPGATGGTTIIGSSSAVGEKDVTKKAIGLGWNVFTPSYCVGTQIGGVYYLYMFMRDGTATWSADPIAISMLSPACVSAPLVAMYVTSAANGVVFWTHVSTYHQ